MKKDKMQEVLRRLGTLPPVTRLEVAHEFQGGAIQNALAGIPDPNFKTATFTVMVELLRDFHPNDVENYVDENWPEDKSKGKLYAAVRATLKATKWRDIISTAFALSDLNTDPNALPDWEAKYLNELMADYSLFAPRKRQNGDVQ